MSQMFTVMLSFALCFPINASAQEVKPEAPASASQEGVEVERQAVDEDGRVVDFARDIAPIFRKHCLECHGPDDAKNDFRVDDPDLVSDYVVAEDVESSSMYTDYLTSDDDDMLMPPRSHGGPLSAAELALIRVWIAEGADWPEGAMLDGSGQPLPAVDHADAANAGLVSRVWSFQGFLHPATVHFPVALLLVGALFVVLGWKWPEVGTQIPLACLVLGAASAIGASMMGWSFAVEKGYGSWTRIDMDSEIFWHRWSAIIVTILSTVLAIIALVSVRKDRPSWTPIWKIGLLVCAGIVGAVGHQGGELTYGKDFYPKAFRILLGQPDPSLEAAPGDKETAGRDVSEKEQAG